MRVLAVAPEVLFKFKKFLFCCLSSSMTPCDSLTYMEFSVLNVCVSPTGLRFKTVLGLFFFHPCKP